MYVKCNTLCSWDKSGIYVEVLGINCGCFIFSGYHFAARTNSERKLWLRAISNIKVKLETGAPNPGPEQLEHYRYSVDEQVTRIEATFEENFTPQVLLRRLPPITPVDGDFMEKGIRKEVQKTPLLSEEHKPVDSKEQDSAVDMKDMLPLRFLVQPSIEPIGVDAHQMFGNGGVENATDRRIEETDESAAENVIIRLGGSTIGTASQEKSVGRSARAQQSIVHSL